VYSFQTDIALCNNVVLAAGLCGTSLKNSTPYSERYIDHSYVDDEAAITEFDVLYQQPVPYKDYIHLRLFEKVTDEEMKKILNYLKI
jgi:hypothetical protein